MLLELGVDLTVATFRNVGACTDASPVFGTVIHPRAVMLLLPWTDAGDEVIRGSFLCLDIDSQRIDRAQPNGNERCVVIDLNRVPFKLAQSRFRIREYFGFLFEYSAMTETKARTNSDSL